MKTTYKRIIAGGVFLAIAVGAFFFYQRLADDKTLPEGLIQANGRIEGDQTGVASKVPGRIARILVDEGDAVVADQVLVVLEATQIEAKVAQGRAQLSAAKAQVTGLEAQLSLLKKDVPLQIDQAEAGVRRAKAIVEKAGAAANQARLDAKRWRELYNRGSIAKQRAEMAELAAKASGADLTAAKQGLIAAIKQSAEARLGMEKIAAMEAGVAGAVAQAEQAAAGLNEVQSVLSDLTLKAVGPGVVTTRVREVGEIVAAGSPVLDLVDMKKLYLKVYVPEIEIGKLRVGLSARVFTDAYPDKPFDAKVTTISQRAQFTPKEVQTTDERVKLTYAVKLRLDENPDNMLTPGMPADAVIRWNDDVEWSAPRW